MTNNPIILLCQTHHTAGLAAETPLSFCKGYPSDTAVGDLIFLIFTEAQLQILCFPVSSGMCPLPIVLYFILVVGVAIFQSYVYVGLLVKTDFILPIKA